MAIYDVDGNIVSDSSTDSILGFDRVYSYVNPYLECVRKTLNNDGSFSDSTTRCVIYLPKDGLVEVRMQKNSGMFKVAKISGSSVTWMDSEWSYYQTRYVGDGVSNYYALVAVTPDGTSALTIDGALDKIAVYQFVDIGEKYPIKSKLNGKTVACIGDSITQGRFRKFATTGLTWSAAKPFPDLIAEVANDMNAGNYGIGGALVATTLTPWMSLATTCTRVNGYDVVFICGGTNDYGNNVPRTTFISAYQTVINTLKSNNTEVVACTPVYRTSKTGKNNQGLTLLDYCNIIKELAASSNIKCIDLYTLTNDGKFITYCPDGLHPNEVGHKIMADLIVQQYDILSN